MTYNVHAGIGMDQKLDLARTAEVIKQADPDIVAIQELDKGTTRTAGIDEPAELGKLTGMHVYFGRTIDYKGGEYGIGILSKTPLEDVKVYELPSSPDHEARGALAGRVKLGDGSSFLFVCTHLDASRGDGDSAAQIAELNRRFAPDQRPVILAGDFNKRPDAKVMAPMFMGWTDAPAGTGLTCPSTNPTMRIDYVFYRPAGRWRVTDAKVIAETAASDHRPVVVELRSGE